MRILLSEIWHSLLTSGPGRADGRPARSRSGRAGFPERAPGRSLRTGESNRRMAWRLRARAWAAVPVPAAPAGSGRLRGAGKPGALRFAGGSRKTGENSDVQRTVFGIPRADPREAGLAGWAWPAACCLGDSHGRHSHRDRLPVGSVQFLRFVRYLRYRRPCHQLHHASVPPQSWFGVLRLGSCVGWWMPPEWRSRRSRCSGHHTRRDRRSRRWDSLQRPPS